MKTELSYFDAVLALVGGQLSGPTDGPVEKFIFTDGQTPPTQEAIKAKQTELQAEYDAKKYQRDRADAYPDLAEQFDLLWHAIDGGKFNVKSKDTDFYKKLKAVKDANPKPE